MKIYRVGGCVRDRLLDRPVKDIDYVVVGATPEQMHARGFRAVGKHFPVFLHPDTGEEYALARTEEKAGPGHTGFAIQAAPSVTLLEDLARRDLTINAMAEAENGELIDPYGGLADLTAKRLVHVGPAFEQDPLRVFRVARFAAELDQGSFEVSTETLDCMARMVRQGQLGELPGERIWAETERALVSEAPVRYFEVLRECGALRAVMPELDRLWGGPQNATHHPEVDTGVHTMMVLEQACALGGGRDARFAALVHDLGKGCTPASQWPRHIDHEKRGVVQVEALGARLRAPAAVTELGKLTSEHHLRVHRSMEMRPKKLMALFQATDALRRPERFGAFVLACEADARGRAGLEHRSYPQRRYLEGALAAARAVEPREIIRPSMSGQVIGEVVYRARLEAVKCFCTQYHRTLSEPSPT